MKPYRLVLLDVDGTLVSCGGAGRRALERVLRKACNEPHKDLSSLRFDGSTDRLIVRHGVELLGHTFTDELCNEVLLRFLPLLEEELKDPSYRILPGVIRALDTLKARKIPHGLCTGNVPEGARLKLKRGALDGYFEWGDGAVGGFGSDGEERSRLVKAALTRARARNGPLSPEEVLVVGDTPQDVEAATQIGCASLGVATGRYTMGELRDSGATLVVPSLAAPEALAILSG